MDMSKVEFQIDLNYKAHLRWKEGTNPLQSKLEAKGIVVHTSSTGWQHCTFSADKTQVAWLRSRCGKSNKQANRMLTFQRAEQIRTGIYGLAAAAKYETQGCEDLPPHGFFSRFCTWEDDEYREVGVEAAGKSPAKRKANRKSKSQLQRS